MSESSTTLNGHEIENSSPILTATQFKERISGVYGLDGSSPTERIGQLKELSADQIAIMLTDINRSIQGSEDHLISDRVVKIGDKETIPTEQRYQVFENLIDDIKSCSGDVNPERVGDVLALGVVMLHPFKDGNGRTARAVGLMFRDSYDTEEFSADYEAVTEPRDLAREKGGFIINGYVPRFSEGFDQSDPEAVSEYLSGLLKNEGENLYTSCYGQAPLYKPE